MPKKLIKTKLITDLEEINNEVIAILYNGEIKYNEDDMIIRIKYGNNCINMRRENDTYQLDLNFVNKEKSIGTYLLKENNMNFELEILTNEIIIEDKRLYLEYILNDEKRIFELIIKE